jgi:hypothetical protein
VRQIGLTDLVLSGESDPDALSEHQLLKLA